LRPAGSRHGNHDHNGKNNLHHNSFGNDHNDQITITIKMIIIEITTKTLTFDL
jgi:hypothetical protein